MTLRKCRLRAARLSELLSYLLLLILLPYARSQAETPQADYMSTTTKLPANGHFAVEITSTSKVPVTCQIQYSGVSFLNAVRSGQQTVLVRAVGKDGTPVLRSTQFGGFRSFTATVECAAK
jgi:hypothetical protein